MKKLALMLCFLHMPMLSNANPDDYAVLETLDAPYVKLLIAEKTFANALSTLTEKELHTLQNALKSFINNDEHYQQLLKFIKSKAYEKGGVWTDEQEMRLFFKKSKDIEERVIEILNERKNQQCLQKIVEHIQNKPDIEAFIRSFNDDSQRYRLSLGQNITTSACLSLVLTGASCMTSQGSEIIFDAASGYCVFMCFWLLSACVLHTLHG